MRLLRDPKPESHSEPNQAIAVARRRSHSALTIQLSQFAVSRLFARACVKLTGAPSCWNQIFDLPIFPSVIPTHIYISRRSFRPSATYRIFKNSSVTSCLSTSCLYVAQLGRNKLEFDWRQLGLSLYRQYGKTPLIWTLFIRISLVCRVNLSRIM